MSKINQGSTIFDVIIIGAGSIGTPAAYYLAKAGLQVLVIDLENSVGQGNNKKAIGGIRATHSDPAKIRLCLRSIEIFSTWEETYGETIEWVQGGYSFVAYRQEEQKALKDLLLVQKHYGLDINWLDACDLLQVIPDLNPQNLLGGTYAPKDGNASPLLVAHSYYQQACRVGAQFLFDQLVVGLITQQGKVTGVKTNQGTFFSGVVLNAAGSQASRIAEMGGTRVPVQTDSHEAGITEPVARFLMPMVVDIRPAPGSSNYYFYQHYTGQIVFCITPKPSIWGDDTRETSDFLPMIACRMVETMPRLANIRVRRTWRGLYPMTPDGMPIIGWSEEVQGFLQAVGMCGQGFMLGPACGELIERIITGNLEDGDKSTLTAFSPYRQFGGQEILK